MPLSRGGRSRIVVARCRVLKPAALALGAALLVGCASHRGLSSSIAEPDGKSESPSDSLSGYVGKVQTLTTRAQPASLSGQTLETSDPRLFAALARLAGANTAANHVAVATEYRRLHVLDLAYRHLSDAVKLDSSNADAYEAQARIWRDWGFARLGLGEAYRAVYLAPDSPAAANTLGTLLEALGRTRDARVWYRRALALDPKAVYALNNDCYASIMLGEVDAVAVCRRAVDANPRSLTTHNNLALAYAAVGDLAAAQREFQESGTPAAARYNTGILYLAQKDFSKAAGAFDEASRLDARSAQAVERSRQARSSALEEETGSDQH